MILRKTLILLILLTLFQALNTQALEKVLEPAILKVVYQRKIVTDTLDRENDFKTNPMTLKVGKSVSAFFSEQRKMSDSLELYDKEYELAVLRDRKAFHESAMLPRDAIFKNFPESKLRAHENFDLCAWIIDEDWEKPQWSIHPDSVASFLGYDCLMATSLFRGRLWRVFFAPEIPVADGPWKLCGLPGIILFAEDSRHDYTYEATSLETENIGNVVYYDYRPQPLTTSREKSLIRKHKYLKEDVTYKIMTSGMFGINKKNVKKRDKIPHKNYDFEETDYPHDK